MGAQSEKMAQQARCRSDRRGEGREEGGEEEEREDRGGEGRRREGKGRRGQGRGRRKRSEGGEEKMGFVLMSEDGRREGCEEVKGECGVKRA